MAKGQLNDDLQSPQGEGVLRPLLKLAALIAAGCFLGSLFTMATADVCTQYDMVGQGGVLLVPFAVLAGMIIAPLMVFFLFGSDGAAGLAVAVPLLVAFGSGLLLTIATFRRLRTRRSVVVPATALVAILALCAAIATFAFCVSMSA